MIVELLFILIANVSADCVRPTDYHWLEKQTPGNTSIELFSANSGAVERIYLNFGDSVCKRPNGGNYVIHCDNHTFSIVCENSLHNHIGLGQNSPVWDHYQHMTFDTQRIILSNNYEKYENQCLLQTHDQRTYLCFLDNITTKWQYRNQERVANMTVIMFSNTEKITVPLKLFQIFEEHVQKKQYDKISFEIVLGNEPFLCGENCLYTNSLRKGFELLARPDLTGNQIDTIELTERFLHFKKIKYSAITQTIHVETEENAITHKFLMQIFLIPKILYGFWTVTRNKNRCLTKPEDKELFFEIMDGIILGIILGEELWMHKHDVVQVVMVVSIVLSILTAKTVEFIMYRPHKEPHEEPREGFLHDIEACFLIGNAIPIVILQTMLQELDSYECVVIALVLQFGFIVYDILFAILGLQPNWIQKSIKLCFLVFLLVLTWLNYANWLSIFFDEIVSLLGYRKSTIVVFFYLIQMIFVFEIWKRRRDQNGIFIYEQKKIL